MNHATHFQDERWRAPVPYDNSQLKQVFIYMAHGLGAWCTNLLGGVASHVVLTKSIRPRKQA